MVVQCTHCQARFRVADEKVPDRGVKVRCTKCSTVFRVTREGTAATSVPPPIEKPPARKPLLGPAEDSADDSQDFHAAPTIPAAPPARALMAPAPEKDLDPFAMDAKPAEESSLDPFAALAGRGTMPPPASIPGPAPQEDDPWESAPPPVQPKDVDPFEGLGSSGRGATPALGTPRVSPTPIPFDNTSLPPPDPSNLTPLATPYPFPREDVSSVGPSPFARGTQERRTDRTARGSPISGVPPKPVRWMPSALANVLGAVVLGYAALVLIAAARSTRPLTPADLGAPVLRIALSTGERSLAQQLHTDMLHANLFPLQSGGQVFYVVGTAKNDSSRRLDAMTVSLDLMRGDQVISHSDALAGLKGISEDLYLQSDRDNVALQRALARRASSFSVDAHHSAPFIGIFKVDAAALAGAEIQASVKEGIAPSLRGITPGAVEPPAVDGAAPHVEAARGP